MLVSNQNFQERLEKRLNDVNSFINSVNNIREKITFLKDQNRKPKKNFKKQKMLAAILKSIDTFVLIATTSRPITLSLAGIGLKAIPISTVTACEVTKSKKVINETVMRKYIENKKQYGKDQQTINSSTGVIYRKSSQDTLTNKNENESLGKSFTKYLDELKNENFLYISTLN